MSKKVLVIDGNWGDWIDALRRCFTPISKGAFLSEFELPGPLLAQFEGWILDDPEVAQTIYAIPPTIRTAKTRKVLVLIVSTPKKPEGGKDEADKR